jgi:ketosteroid isomerase-like protein
MTVKWRAAVALGCASVAAVALWLTFFRASDEDRIRRAISELAKIVMVKDGDTILSRMARMRTRMKEIVDDDVRVNVAELGMDIRGRHTFEEDAAKAGLMFQSADCEFTNLGIKVDPAGTVATVDALALVTAKRGGERKIDKRDVHFLLRKDGDWKITTLDVATLRKDD